MSLRENRAADTIRDVEITTNFLKYPEGSVLYRAGDTMVVCTATVDDRVKDWLRGRNKGWVTAEYAMLPRANDKRGSREGWSGRWPAGRSQEIQRVIGRAIRAAIRLDRLGERTITIDCDVLQGDGGTRTASVTGGFIALAIALDRLVKSKAIKSRPLKSMMAAVSAGVVKGELLLDLDYKEDSAAEVDLNVAGDEQGRIAEIQGTSENQSYNIETYFELTKLAQSGVQQLINLQREALLRVGVDVSLLIDPA